MIKFALNVEDDENAATEDMPKLESAGPQITDERMEGID